MFNVLGCPVEQHHRDMPSPHYIELARTQSSFAPMPFSNWESLYSTFLDKIYDRVMILWFSVLAFDIKPARLAMAPQVQLPNLRRDAAHQMLCLFKASHSY